MTKKILFFDFFDSMGGAQQSTQTLINHLSKMESGVEIAFISPFSGVSNFKSGLKSKIKNLDVPFSNLLFRFSENKFNPLLYLSLCALFIKLCFLLNDESKKSDVTVVCSSRKALFALVRLRKFLKRGIKVAFYCRGDGKLGSQKLINYLNSNAVNRVFSVSKRTKNALKEAGICERKILVTYTSIDYSTITYKAQSVSYEPGRYEVVILYAASIILNKGLDILLAALKSSSLDRQGVQLRIAGKVPNGADSNYLSFCKSVAADLKLDVEWLGWSENVPGLIASSDLVCLPSLSEGLPRIVQESHLLKTLIISTDVGGTRELYPEKYAELFVCSPNNVSELRNVINYSSNILSSESYAAITEALYEHCLNTYEIQNQSLIFLEAVYAKI